jgi:hypothetical protein
MKLATIAHVKKSQRAEFGRVRGPEKPVGPYGSLKRALALSAQRKAIVTPLPSSPSG